MNYPNITRNKAIILLRKIGMPMKEITRAFGKKDKRNLYRIWHRDKDKYDLPKQPSTSERSDL